MKMACRNNNQDENKDKNNVLEFVDESINDDNYRNLMFPKRIYCPNKKHGCKYISTVQKMPEHIKTCKIDNNLIYSPSLTQENSLDWILKQVGDVNVKVEKICGQLNKFKNKMLHFEKREKENKSKIDIELENIVGQVNTVAQHLHEANSMLQNNIFELQGICKDFAEKQTKADEKTTAIYKEMTNLNALYETVKKIEKVQIHNRILSRSMKTKLEELEASEALNSKSTESLIRQVVKETVEAIKSEVQSRDTFDNRKQFGEESIIVSHIRQNILTPQYKLTEPLFFFDGNLYNILVHSLKITNISQKTALGAFQYESEAFALPIYNFGAQIFFKEQRDGWIHVSMIFTNTNRNRKPFHLPAYPRFTYILKDRSKNEHCRDKIQSDIQLFNTELSCQTTYHTFVYLNPKWLRNPLYNVRDSVTLEIHVESPSLAHQAFSHDGVLMWKVCNYRKKKQMALQELVFYQLSPYFYTGPRGYRLQVRVWLNNYDQRETKNLKFDVCFCSGEFDRCLPPSFPHKTTVTLFNHLDGNKHLVQSMEADVRDKPAYSIDIAPRQEVEEGGYILDDTLFYKVAVQSSPKPLF